MSRRQGLFFASALGAAVVAVATLAVANAPAKPNVKNLLQTPLSQEFTKDRDVLVDLVEIPPNASLERHWHPGEEFHYYLEGEVEIRIDGQPSIIGKPGMVGHVPFKATHQAIAGPKGAKILVTRVHSHGLPWRYTDAPKPE